jgi:signal transduction histidine kinase
MRRKLIIAFVLLSATFVLGGSYIVGTTYSSTRSLDRLIVLHQVQIFREQLLAEVQAVQSALKSKDTRFYSGPGPLIENVRRMREAIQGCFECHHSGISQSKLIALRDYGKRYEERLSRVITVRANQERLKSEQDMAYVVGNDLISMLQDMITITLSHLEQKTHASVRSINRANSLLVAMVAIGPLGLLALGVLLDRSFARPLSTLIDATRALKAGDMSARVSGLENEFRELGDSFNEMVEAINNHVSQMQRTEQMAVCGQLAAGIAHEIKNPLAAIKLTLQVLAAEMGLNDDDRRLFQKVEEEAGRIETLMKDLLSYARPKEPVRSMVDVNELLDRAGLFGLQRFPAPNGRSSTIELRKELDPNLPNVFADPDQLLQVFLNVVLNAIEAMPDGGVLSIRAWNEDGSVNVEICDQGRGVPGDLREKIFEPFFTRKPKGTGLGLAVSKRLVEQNGGTIRVGEGPDGGACFQMRLPASIGEA